MKSEKHSRKQSGKALGVDNITAEIMKTDMETTVKELHTLFNTIWTTAKTPND